MESDNMFDWTSQCGAAALSRKGRIARRGRLIQIDTPEIASRSEMHRCIRGRSEEKVCRQYRPYQEQAATMIQSAVAATTQTYFYFFFPLTITA